MPSGDDRLTVAEVAKALGVSEEWIEGHRFLLPCEVTLKTGAMHVRRRDLPEWARAAKPREIRTADQPEKPTHRALELMQRCVRTAADYGSPGWRP